MNKAFIYIILGAALWGSIGFYVENLYVYGFTPMEVVTLRVLTASIILLVFMIFRSPKQLKLKKWTDISYFIGTGIFSIIFFNYFMFKTIELASISVASALLYTGPAFVIVLSFLLFKEPMTKRKVMALIITLIGTTLVVELFPFNLKSIPLVTIITGLSSGFGYALYSIFSKFALKKYSSLAVTTYTFTVAAVALIPFFPFKAYAELLMDVKVLFFAFGLGFLPTAIAYIIYTYGLQMTEASNASLLATVEPVVATLIGIFVFQEGFGFSQMVGMACIIGAVILVQIELPKKRYVSLKKKN